MQIMIFCTLQNMKCFVYWKSAHIWMQWGSKQLHKLNWNFWNSECFGQNDIKGEFSPLSYQIIQQFYF